MPKNKDEATCCACWIGVMAFLAVSGGIKAAARLARCNPFSDGGHEPLI
jgi:putative component of membrane protein insertase Oxa1/YidC/SpoIIIJ protein YidD